MKLRLFSVLLVISHFLFAQMQWETINPKPSSGDNKVVAFSNSIGYIINNSKELLFSDDLGETWKLKQTLASANDMQFSSNNGYIIGDNGYVLKSVDSGANWTQVNIGSSDNLNSVSVFSDKIIIGSATKLFISTDGVNWTSKMINIPNPWVRKSVFTTATEGHIYSSGFVYKTTDGGNTWSQTLSYGSIPNDLNMLYFKNKNEGYINFGHSEFRKTIDGGETWTAVNGSFLYAINSMFFTDQNTGFAVGTYGNIYKTTDNGVSWQRHPESYFTDDGKSLKSIGFSSSTHGFAVGNNGIILKTINGGSTWSPNSFMYDSTNEIQRVNDQFYIQGGNKLYKSTDLKTWQSMGSPLLTDYPYIMDFQMVSPSVAYALVGTAGSSNLSKSIDGGQTWNMVPNTYGGAHRLKFVSEQVGYRYGSGVSKTVDGGQTWSIIQLPYSVNVQFLSENLAFAMEGSKLYKTTDGGVNFVLINTVADYASDFQFINEQEGYILSNYSVLKTKDGGLTWEKIPTYKSYQYANFQNANIGYLSGQYSDDHLYTEDGGATWKSLSKPFSDISRNIIQNQLYIGGTYGKMARTDLSVSTLYIETKSVVGITAQKADIRGYGSVNSGILESIAFEYSTSSSFANVLSVNALPVTISAGQNSQLTGTVDQLNPSTIYFVRLKAVHGGVSYYSNTLEFRTKEAFTENLTFTKKKSSSVVLNTVISSNDDKGVQNIKILYGTDINNLNQVISVTPDFVVPNATQTVQTLAESLEKNTTYYFKIKLSYNGSEYLGKVYTYKTIDGAELYLFPYDPYYKKLSGYAQADEKLTNIVFQYGTQNFENTITANSSEIVEGSSGYVNSVSSPVFDANKTYYIRMKANHLDDSIFSNIEVFNPFSPVVIARNNEEMISDSSVKINALINTSGYTASNMKVVYGLSADALTSTVAMQPNVVSNYETSTVGAELTGIDFNTTYYYRFVAQTNTGKLTDYTSEIYSFKLAQLGVNQKIPGSVSLYPNPVSDYLSIETNHVIKLLEIYDLQGRLQKTLTPLVGSSLQKIDISALNSGVYVIRIGLKSGAVIDKKIIKK